MTILRAASIAALLVSFLAVHPLPAQEPKVRATLETKGDLWIGQRVTVAVELLAPGLFAGSPSFDLPNPSGLLLLPPSGSPVLDTETIDGASYTVQRHEIAIFARRGGPQTIPAFTVRFEYRRQPLDPQPMPASLKTDPLQFTAKVPPGAEALGSLLSARDLAATESWKPETLNAKVGDAFTRTIQYTATDIPGMAFPPFPASKVDGLGLYPKTPVVEDHANRGEVQGKRRDVFVYVCQRPGTFIIPAARLTWLDLEARQLRTIDFPPRKLLVAPNPALASAPAADTRPPFPWHILWRWAAGLGLAVAAAWTAWKLGVGAALRKGVACFRSVPLAPLNPPAPSPRDQLG